LTLAITGATGFVGQAMVERALAAGLRPAALTRRMGGGEYTSGKAQPLWVEGSLADAASLARLCEGADSVLHIAGAVNLPTRAQFAAVNIDGTRAVVDAARAAGVRRFIHVSSLAAREPGLSDYGWSKRMAEEVVQVSGLDWVIVRPPAIYGPRDREILELFRTARWRVLPMPPAGRASLLHVDDLARLLLALVPPGEASQRILEPDDNHAGGWAHGELAAMIGAAVGKSVWAPGVPRAVLGMAARIDRMVRGDRAKLTPDRARYMCHPDWVSDPARAVPPALWQAQIASAEGLAETARWYRAHGWL
jgi:UDP-glucose 4-epimerase